ncbi:MAG TPA: diiron oxygenase [Acidimicrobiales bacterium]|nr:diiron oxygenase [Acidimicrobiales bacterium]
MSEDVAVTAARLSASSRRSYQNPYEAISWPESLDRSQWFMSPELISIFGTPLWDELTEERQRLLGFWEAVNFFSLNIHGEKALIEGLARRLYRPGLEEVSEYLHHFLDEENKHSVWFATFCLRYAGKIYPDRKVVFPREYAEGEEDLLFFAKVAIFEEIVDRYNVVMGRDERLDPLARRINANHHAEETRHLVFGRRIVEHLWQRHSPSWTAETVAGMRSYLTGYLDATWREYYNPEVYRDTAFADPYGPAREAWAHPVARAHRETLSRACLRFLTTAGVLEEEAEA